MPRLTVLRLVAFVTLACCAATSGAEDLLTDGAFDDPADVTPWLEFNDLLDVEWSPDDAFGEGASGSIRLRNSDPAGNSGIKTVVRCVQLTPGASYRLTAQAKVPSGQTKAGTAVAILYFYDANNCNGTRFGQTFSTEVSAPGTWQSLGTDVIDLEDDARSVEIALGNLKVDDGGSVDVLFDEVQMEELDGDCAPSSKRLCLTGNRFGIEVEWLTPDGTLGTGTTRPMTSDSGLFWFFEPDNLEVLVKVLDACAINNHFWVYLAATTDVNYRLTVTDTKTGQTQQYINPQGVRAQAIADIEAFGCP